MHADHKTNLHNINRKLSIKDNIAGEVLTFFFFHSLRPMMEWHSRSNIEISCDWIVMYVVCVCASRVPIAHVFFVKYETNVRSDTNYSANKSSTNMRLIQEWKEKVRNGNKSKTHMHINCKCLLKSQGHNSQSCQHSYFHYNMILYIVKCRHLNASGIFWLPTYLEMTFLIHQPSPNIEHWLTHMMGCDPYSMYSLIPSFIRIQKVAIFIRHCNGGENFSLHKRI